MKAGSGRRYRCGATESVTATQAGIVRGLPGVSATADSVSPDDGQPPDLSIRHILLVAYLYPPVNAVSAHRPAGLRRAFESAGIRTTVLTSEISGSYDDDERRGSSERAICAHVSVRSTRPSSATEAGPLEARGEPTVVDELHRPGSRPRSRGSRRLSCTSSS